MFRDRTEAGYELGQLLAERLEQSGVDRGDMVIVGLPRGGVPVAYEVAKRLNAPLDIIMVRKLGVPFQREVAMGAIAEGGIRVLNDDVLTQAEISAAQVALVEEQERRELTRRASHYRPCRRPPSLTDKTVVIVDDGIATGSTAKAACAFARQAGASIVVLAVPVASSDWQARLGDHADLLVALTTPADFQAVGQYYRDFGETTDNDVLHCLGRAATAASEAT